MQKKFHIIILLLLFVWLVGCTPTLEPVVSERATATPSLTPTPILPTPFPSGTPTPNMTLVPMPTLPPIPSPTPLNPDTDLGRWRDFYHDDLRLALRYPPEWAVMDLREDGMAFDTVPEGEYQWMRHIVTIQAIPNPDGLPFAARIAAWLGVTPPLDFPYETGAAGPYLAYRTVDTALPDELGTLTVFLEEGDRFLAFTLTPAPLVVVEEATRVPPDPWAHYHHVQFLDAVLASVRLGADAEVVQGPTPVPTPGSTTGRSTSPIISANGRFVAFLSTLALTSNADLNYLSIFVKDTENNTVELISQMVDGRDVAYDIYGMAMSGNGQVVAYYSHDGYIVEDDELDCGTDAAPVSCEDLFVHDRSSGETVRIPLGRGQGLGGDYSLAVSADGRFIAYGHERNLWVYDRESGTAAPQLSNVSGGEPEAPAFAPAFAGNGRYLLFVSAGADLVPDDTNETYDVFLLDRETGDVERISTARDGGSADGTSGAQPFHEGVGHNVAISADARFIAFSSQATNLTGNVVTECDDYRGFTRACYHIYLYDRETETMRQITVETDGDSTDPALSADGRFLSFTSTATNLTYYSGQSCGDYALDAGCPSVYLYDRELGSITFLSMGPDVVPANASSWSGNLSGDGRFLVFSSKATNLLPNDTNDGSDIFRLDRQTGTVELISTPAGP